jgi:hypothetical protein
MRLWQAHVRYGALDGASISRSISASPPISTDGETREPGHRWGLCNTDGHGGTGHYVLEELADIGEDGVA